MRQAQTHCAHGAQPTRRNAIITFAAAAATIWTLVASSPVEAAACKDVKLSFNNHSGATIKVRNARFTGNRGTWTEDFANLKIAPGAARSTGGRRMNKLDVGHPPAQVEIAFDIWMGKPTRWVSRCGLLLFATGVNGQPGPNACSDGRTYELHISGNDNCRSN
ncbi:MAG: hypothetical protein R3E83_04790 [Burkholderiaceae bacterium]